MASFFVVVLGLVIGSFLNVLVYRLEKGESVCAGRSRCPHCGHTLSWYDLVPLLSFAMLRGRCRYCGDSISWQYPIVEIVTGMAFLAIFNFKFLIFNQFLNVQIFNILQLLLAWGVASLLIAIAAYDIKHLLIPDALIHWAAGGAALLLLLSAYELGRWSPVWSGLLAAAGAGAFFFALYYFSKERWMGFGDVKLAAFMGLFLSWPRILPALFLAFVAGALVGLALMAINAKTMKSQLPFAPFLVFGTFAAFIAGAEIIEWYMGRLVL